MAPLPAVAPQMGVWKKLKLHSNGHAEFDKCYDSAPLPKQPRLSGALDPLEIRNRQAIEDKLAYTEFLALLVSDEVARREQKKLALRLRRASFRGEKTLENFDFAEWGDAFPNRLLGAATLDRLRHGAYRVILEGERYRCPRPLSQPSSMPKSTLAKDPLKP